MVMVNMESSFQTLDTVQTDPATPTDQVDAMWQALHLVEEGFLLEPALTYPVWTKGVRLFKQRRGAEALSYYMEWLRGRTAGWAGGVPKAMPTGLVVVYNELEKGSEAPGSVSHARVVAAHGGDPGLFQTMHHDANGRVASDDFFLFFLTWVL